MKEETKVGLFVLIGALFLGIAIFLLGNFSFKKYYHINVKFRNVSGLALKSNVKLNGVDVGKVNKINIDGEYVIIDLAVEKGVPIYKDSKFYIGSTSMIGSKFLQIEQGKAISGEIKDNEIVFGENIPSMETAIIDAVKNLDSFMNNLNQKGDFTKNLNSVVENLRDLTVNLNEMISISKPNFENSMSKLDSLLSKTDEIVSKINNGEGVIGSLLNDNKSRDEIKETINNIKDTSISLKKILGKTSQIKTYWVFDTRYESLSDYTMNSVGIKLYTNKDKYYYAGISNFFNTKNSDKKINYEIKNTVDAYMGFDLRKFDIYFGAIRGAAGIGVRYKPFLLPVWKNLSFLVEANEFSRNRKIKDRYFDKPRYDVGAEYKINKYIQTGLRVSDLLETKTFSYDAKVTFEDKDLAMLFSLFGGGASSMAVK